MTIRQVIERHAPNLRYLIGVIPDDELCERLIVEATDTEREEMISYDQNQRDIDNAADDAREEVTDEILGIIDDGDWITGEELAKLIRRALE